MPAWMPPDRERGSSCSMYWSNWRELVVAPAERVIPVPDAVSDQDACTGHDQPRHRVGIDHGRASPSPGASGSPRLPPDPPSAVWCCSLRVAKGFARSTWCGGSRRSPRSRNWGGDQTLCTEDSDWPAQFARIAESGRLKKAIDCVGGRVGATVSRGLQTGGRLLVYGALSSHRQSDPAAFEMPIFAPRLIYSASSVQGWFLFHWLNITPVAETSAALRSVLDRLATGQLRLPPRQDLPSQRIGDRSCPGRIVRS